MKKMHCLLAALLVVAGLGLAACGDDDTGGYTYSATDLPMDVPGDGSSAISSISVSDAPASINKVTVTVTIHHTNTGELFLGLASPAWPGSGSTGTAVLTYGDGTSGAAAGYINVTFDDDALNSIVGATMPINGFSGYYRPEEPLNAFNATDANGLWRLLVLENGATEVNGQITAWSITFE